MLTLNNITVRHNTGVFTILFEVVVLQVPAVYTEVLFHMKIVCFALSYDV